MSKLTKKEIKIYQNFDKTLKDHVSKHHRRNLCLSIRGSQVVLSGKENTVELARENLESMTVADLMEAMKVMENDNDDEEEMRYKSTEVPTNESEIQRMPLDTPEGKRSAQHLPQHPWLWERLDKEVLRSI